MLKKFTMKYLMQFIDKNTQKFVTFWVLLAFVPLVGTLFFDAMVTGQNHPVEASILQYVSLISIFSILFTMILTLRLAFYKGTKGYTRLMVIGVAYFVIWVAFANLYYGMMDIESYANCVLRLDGKQVKIFSGIHDFWQGTSNTAVELVPGSVNRLTNYVDCLYFSGISIVTIGFGDIVPVNSFCKLLVLVETFGGQILTVAAVGLCFAGISSTNEAEAGKSIGNAGAADHGRESTKAVNPNGEDA